MRKGAEGQGREAVAEHHHETGRGIEKTAVGLSNLLSVEAYLALVTNLRGLRQRWMHHAPWLLARRRTASGGSDGVAHRHDACLDHVGGVVPVGATEPQHPTCGAPRAHAHSPPGVSRWLLQFDLVEALTKTHCCFRAVLWGKESH
eukprot:3598890-Rhodomonas_salina.1